MLCACGVGVCSHSVEAKSKTDDEDSEFVLTACHNNMFVAADDCPCLTMNIADFLRDDNDKVEQVIIYCRQLIRDTGVIENKYKMCCRLRFALLCLVNIARDPNESSVTDFKLVEGALYSSLARSDMQRIETIKRHHPEYESTAEGWRVILGWRTRMQRAEEQLTLWKLSNLCARDR